MLGNVLYGEQGDDRLFLWSGGWGYGGQGDDEIFQYSSDAVLDGGNGDDQLISEDVTSTVEMERRPRRRRVH